MRQIVYDVVAFDRTRRMHQGLVSIVTRKRSIRIAKAYPTILFREEKDRSVSDLLSETVSIIFLGTLYCQKLVLGQERKTENGTLSEKTADYRLLSGTGQKDTSPA